MLKNITIGQYVPGDSAVHRMDPRTKILGTLLLIVTIFLIKSFWGYGFILAMLMLATRVAGLKFSYVLRGLKALWLILGMTFLLNVFLTDGEVIFSLWRLRATKEGIRVGVFMAARLMLLVTGTSILTLTTSPISLTDGIEKLLSPFRKIGLPAHELAMMMTIALRFIPILLDETDKIMKAQAGRGVDFETGSLIQRAKSMLPILVPLFILSFKKADDLAVAMEARCYRGGEGRTKLKTLAFGRVDAVGGLIMLAFMLCGIFLPGVL